MIQYISVTSKSRQSSASQVCGSRVLTSADGLAMLKEKEDKKKRELEKKEREKSGRQEKKKKEEIAKKKAEEKNKKIEEKKTKPGKSRVVM